MGLKTYSYVLCVLKSSHKEDGSRLRQRTHLCQFLGAVTELMIHLSINTSLMLHNPHQTDAPTHTCLLPVFNGMYPSLKKLNSALHFYFPNSKRKWLSNVCSKIRHIRPQSVSFPLFLSCSCIVKSVELLKMTRV